ncbi:hypothetical protein BP6252_02927 [Coleophoma cylindrospora]|uniref:DUF7053 domain-containing protein n=1 Tax=Coleophoma cylindrospora TaxID=1849047 RepID=A0A3D8SG67_9HELO|nr:hypothetical protein BP6252_02927 [Coleophoma cylindrospora]
MTNVSMLSTLEFPSLTAVNTISFISLPAVSQFTFTSGLSSVSNVIISNTFLYTLDGINLQNADNVFINNNNRLFDVSLPLETAKVGIWIESNGYNLHLNLTQLTSAGSITLKNISMVSLPSLSFLSGGLSLIDTSVLEFTADSLSVVTQDLIMLDNSNLSDTSFQGLLSAGSINIKNNTGLNSISFEKLSRVPNVSIGGSFTSIEMPALISVNDTFTLQSTDPNFNCSTFDADVTKSIINGNYTCLGVHQALASSTTPQSGSNPKPNSGLSGGGKAGIIVACLVVAIATAAGAFFLTKRKKGKKEELATIGMDGKAEMENREVPRKELPANTEAYELTEEHGIVEIGANEPSTIPYELPDATPEEFHCKWYQMTDKVNYLPLGLYSGRVTYKACFHNLADGLQTHVYTPLGLSIKGRWTVGVSLLGEPIKAVELGMGLPISGLWLREDVTLKCSILATKFVRKTLTKAHTRLVDRPLAKAQLTDMGNNAQMWRQRFYLPLNLPTSPEIQLPIFPRELTDIDRATVLPMNDLVKSNGKRFKSTSSAPPIPRKSELRPSIDKHHQSHFQNFSTPIHVL